MESINTKRFLKSIFKEVYPEIVYSKVIEKPSCLITKPDTDIQLITGFVFWDTADISTKSNLMKKIKECDVRFEFFPFTEITMNTKSIKQGTEQ